MKLKVKVKQPSKVVCLHWLDVVAHDCNATTSFLRNLELPLTYQINVCSPNFNALYDCSVRYKHFVVACLVEYIQYEYHAQLPNARIHD